MEKDIMVLEAPPEITIPSEPYVHVTLNCHVAQLVVTCCDWIHLGIHEELRQHHDLRQHVIYVIAGERR
jgi:hypothetical protein